MDQNNAKLAREKLAPYKFTDMKFFILYPFSFFPSALWRWVHCCKARGELSWINYSFKR